jgi:hypothetical protein
MATAQLSFHDRQHIARLLVQEKRVAGIFNNFTRAIAPEMRKWSDANNRNSVWVRNSDIERAIDHQLLELKKALENEIINNQKIAWTLANIKNDELAERFIRGMNLSSVVKDGMFSRNLDGLRALQNRVDNGMNLSQRIWAITDQTKTNIEMFLENGIATGRSAEAIGRDFRQMLNNPDKRFRRVRNEKGELVPSQPMKGYNPGRGVYRSAKMNALRVAVTETNMGYRVSDCERWQGLGFVLGYEVQRSRNAKPCVICDALVGKYPKDFIFPGWHPFCICFATPIVMNHDDFADFLLNDEIPQGKIIRDIPPKAREWIEKYREKSGSTPMFVERNAEWFNGQGIIAQGEQMKIDFSGSNEGKFVNISRQSAIDNLISVNEYQDHEESYTFLKDGLVYWKRSSVNNKTAIRFTTNEWRLFKGGDLFHNHPSVESLSPNDIYLAIKNELKSISAINNNGRIYTAVPTKNTVLPHNDFESFRKYWYDVQDAISNKRFYSLNSREQLDFLINITHYTNVEICRQLKIRHFATPD